MDKTTILQSASKSMVVLNKAISSGTPLSDDDFVTFIQGILDVDDMADKKDETTESEPDETPAPSGIGQPKVMKKPMSSGYPMM